MHVSSPLDVTGRRVLIIEHEEQLAADMAAWVRSQGGEAVGPIASPEMALVALHSWSNLDAVMVDIETANGLTPILLRQFDARGIAVIWIIGDDGWFFDSESAASVYRLEGDLQNVVRVKWPKG